MQFDRSQLDLIAKYFADLSKILIASIVVGFFVPTGSAAVSLAAFVWGLIFAVGCFVFSVDLAKEKR